jgi:hypothetical protein
MSLVAFAGGSQFAAAEAEAGRRGSRAKSRRVTGPALGVLPGARGFPR